jgi:hypothetical protein
MVQRDAPDPGAPPVGGEAANVVRNADNRGPRDHIQCKGLTQAERTGAIHAGWNDAAFGRPQRRVPEHLVRWYELGYSGGLLFRRRRRQAPLE